MLALAIFIATLALVIWQPKKLGIGWSALAGAAVALATGVVGWADVGVVWHIVWDATFTFVALIVISLLLDEAGFFGWAALHVARLGRGHGPRLLPLIVLLGAGISAFFANDGSALLLTPIVVGILVSLRLPTKTALAFVLACGFIADTASLPFVISNLVNIVSANFFDVSFSRYALIMVPVDIVSVAVTLGVLWLAFRHTIPAHYAVANLPAPRSAIVDHAVFRAAFPLLALLLAAYFVLAPWHVPFCIVTGAGAIALLAIASRGGKHRPHPIAITRVLKQAPWQIVLFSLGMYVVVYGLGQAGLTHAAATVLTWLAQHGQVIATVGTGFLAAILASIMNNMPSTLVGALAISHAQVPALTHHLMVFANVIGNDLGPKFTPIGSLATLLWLHVLAGKGHRIGWGQYMKVGIMLTPPVLLATLLALVFWLPLVGT